MINLIIWSKDRASQLELLLRSIKQNIPNMFAITIIYTYSNKLFEDGYKKLIGEIKDVEFIYENNFYNDTVSACYNSNMEYISFCTDDTVFYDSCSYTFDDLLGYLPNNVNQVFSFRLGLNTLAQDIHYGTIQTPLMNHVYLNKDIISWNCKKYASNFNYGYPLALDAHVFKKDLICDLLKRYNKWKTTNELEGHIQQSISEIDYITSFDKSIAVNVPLNNLSNITQAGHNYNYSNDFLNQKFLNGERLSLQVFDTTKIIGCHQEVDLLEKDG